MKNSSAPNRLAKEKSPYLLQHAHNPVEWYPWGPEAFEKARTENKMIFLSIGYSTCHWCHVMAHESFESEEIAALLNKLFVPVKVDREERPDLDQIYMSAVQALTGQGGWPLTVFLTPKGEPVTGGTYFPPVDKWGRAGMKTILPRLAQTWQEKKEEMMQAASQLSKLLEERMEGAKDEAVLPDLFAKAEAQYEASFDPDYGGFGKAPKFPRSHDLSFLLRMWKKTKKDTLLQMITKTLESMARGGMYDHLGGGFARYSTDERWLVPHFEKMLYDQAVLARTYLEAYQATHREYYAEVAKDIFEYVLRDMTDAQGGFYSAEDADSEGEEGKFYVWKPAEILEVIGPDRGPLFNAFYGVMEGGNFEHGTSILNIEVPIEEFAKARSLNLEAFKKELNLMRRLLFEVRTKRIPPHKDDKILTAWNGLMISAFAIGAQILGEEKYAKAASRAAGFILKNLSRNGRLLRRYRGGESAIDGFQDDYAFFIQGLLDLYEATLEVHWLEEAKRLVDDMIRLFWDEKDGGFFYSAADSEKLIARPKEFYDGATPSGNSIADGVLLRLSRMTGVTHYETKAEQTFQANVAAMNHYPVAYPQMLSAYDYALGPSQEVVLAGDKNTADFKRMERLFHQNYEPNRVVIYHPANGPDKARIEALAPFVKNQAGVSGKTVVYICENHTCRMPVSTLEDLENFFRSK